MQPPTACSRRSTSTTAELEIVLDCSEFTCRCPITAQPDWATIEIRYRPGPRVVETKSLKLYLETFREVGIFHEHLAKRIRDDLVTLLEPDTPRGHDAVQPPRRHRRQRDLELRARLTPGGACRATRVRFAQVSEQNSRRPSARK